MEQFISAEREFERSSGLSDSRDENFGTFQCHETRFPSFICIDSLLEGVTQRVGFDAKEETMSVTLLRETNSGNQP